MSYEIIEDEHLGELIPFERSIHQTYDKEYKIRLSNQVYNPLAPYQPMKPYSYRFDNVYRGWRSRGDWISEWKPVYRRYVSTPYKTDIILTATTNPPLPSYKPTHDAALNNMYKKMSLQKMQAMVSFLERRKTANMLLDRAKQTARVLHRLWRFDVRGVVDLLGLSTKHVKSKHAKKLRRYRAQYQRKHGAMPDVRTMQSEPRLREAMGSVSGFYMEIRYGFRPLLGDIDDAMTALAVIPPVAYFNVTGGKTSEIKNEYRYDDGSTKLTRLSDVSLTMKCSVTLIAACDFTTFVSKYGLDDVLSTAYETVPLSWMLDWVFPVGQYLKNCNAVAGLAVVQYCTTEFVRYNSTNAHSEPYDYPYYGPSTTGRSNGVRMERTVSTLPPVPLPKFTLDGLAKPWHIADAIGLLTSAIFGPKGQNKKYRI